METISAVHLYDILQTPGLQIQLTQTGAIYLMFANTENRLGVPSAYLYLAPESNGLMSITLEASVITYMHPMLIDQVSIYPTVTNTALMEIEINLRCRQTQTNGLGGKRGNVKIKVCPYTPEEFNVNSEIFGVGWTYQDVMKGF